MALSSPPRRSSSSAGGSAFSPSRTPSQASSQRQRRSSNGGISVATSEATSPSDATVSQTQSPLPKQPSTPNRNNNNSCAVQVAVRIRPILGTEAGSDQCIRCLSKTALQIGDHRTGPSFTFDRVFDPMTLQADFFVERVAPLVDSVLEGYHATCLAYGQTGSGKTFTILGPLLGANATVAANHNNNNPHLSHMPLPAPPPSAGVLPRAMRALFDRLKETTENSDWQVRVQFLELYGEDLRDLLVTNHHHHHSSSSPSRRGNDHQNGKLTIRDLGQDEPEVVGATWTRVTTAEQALSCLHQGQLRRVTAATAMNATSSRSHAILSVAVEQQQRTNETVKRSKFSFVDLAGSERQKRTQATGLRLKEGIDINKGLLVLGNVISALGDPKKAGKTFVPYRDSKLTRLLKGSLGGNHKTLMIACVSPAATNLEESLNCLRYANRAKNIQNAAVVNLDPQSRRLADLQTALQAVATDWLRASNGEELQLTPQGVQALLSASNGGGAQPAQQGLVNLLQTATPANHRDSEQAGTSASHQQQLDDLMRQLQDSQRHHDAAEKELSQLRASHIAMDLDGDMAALVDKVAEYELEVSRMRRALAATDAPGRGQDEMDHDIEEAQGQLRVDRERLILLQKSLSALSEGTADAASVSSRSIENLEELEDAQMQEWTSKYIKDDDINGEPSMSQNDEPEEEEITPTAQKQAEQQKVQEELANISKSIAAKEDLIEQLKTTKEKYEGMREFYELKLKMMEETLAEREVEREKLMLELRSVKEHDGVSQELESRLEEKEQHIAILRRKHKELFDLTKVSSRNDNEILRLQTDVNSMKRKKVDLQKQLSLERKSHANEMKKVKKTVLQQDRELNKWKKVSGKHEADAQRANQLAKTRLEELGQLRNKYKGAEKELRLQSLKHGVMAKAGLDPVLVGRRSGNGKTNQPASQNQRTRNTTTPPVDPDSIRDYFDQKVADIARRENLVDKLAVEWEEHFGLATRRQELVNAPESDSSSDALQSLDVQLRFKEDRIRQLAKRLGKNPPGTSQDTDRADDGFLYGPDFVKLSRGCTQEQAKGVAARVLFGMIVRERRRVAALARTASALDEKAQVALEASQLSKAALLSYEDEQRQQYADLARSQQDNILSLMDMVKVGSERSSVGSIDQASDGTPELLVLANERIALLESQIEDLQSGAAISESYRENLEDLEAALGSKSQECDDLHTSLSNLRSAIRQIRESASQYSENSGDYEAMYASILRTVEDALHPNQTSPPSGRKGSYRSSTASLSESIDEAKLSPRLKKHVELMHSSDSDDNDEEPEWANAIMADLAFIADGKLPPALEATATVAESGSQLGSTTVFDRLANPKTFTGTQRRAQLTKDQDSGSRLATRTTTGHEERAARSEEIADQLGRIVIPGSKASPLPQEGTVKRRNVDTSPSRTVEGRASLSGEKEASRSVFDRLVSPTHFTGTQKEKHLLNRARRDRSAEVVADRLLNDLLQNAQAMPTPEVESLNTRSVYTDYTQQDVFERLQKTTTQAYVSKHTNTPLAETAENQRSASSLSGLSGHSRHGAERDPARQDVFERLQKKMTEAYAKKTKR